jgi:putative flavoprotein involved in K+ transport
MTTQPRTEQVDTVVIGGGQTGLIVGHGLRKRGIDFVILDASERVGDAWRNRWDSLRLFTQARMNGLPGMAFPASGGDFVGKDAVADFLEDYAATMDLPVRSGVQVTALRTNGTEFTIETTRGGYSARNVVVAMADYQQPKTPEFAADLDPSVVQMHSTDYKNPGQLQDGNVLVVGLGNSGADIAYETSKTHRTIVSGTENGAVPFALESRFGRTIGTRLVRFAMVKILNTSTPMGRRARPKMLDTGPPLVRVRPKELEAAGVERVARIAGIENGMPVTTDGTQLEVSNVVWCTGYRTGFDWIDLPVFDDNGHPNHDRGIVPTEPGLYFVGLFFLHSLWSETITGVQPDVKHVIDHLTENRPATNKPEPDDHHQQTISA